MNIYPGFKHCLAVDEKDNCSVFVWGETFDISDSERKKETVLGVPISVKCPVPITSISANFEHTLMLDSDF